MSRAANKKAMALILVLWTIAVLSLLAGGLSFALRQDLTIANMETDRLTAHYLARAGLERAIVAVMGDSPLSDSPSDLWYDDTEMKNVKLNGGTFSVVHDNYEVNATGTYGAGDECAKLNVNVATRDQLLKLPNMTEEIAAAIIDWRDSDEDPQPGGVERAYYDRLEHPYTIRNGPVQTVRELLLVRGVTPGLFYGEDVNLNGVLDTNENDGDASEPADNADGRLDRGWFAYVTIYSYEKNVDGYGEQRTNLNKADEGTLAERLNLETWAAKSIIKARPSDGFKHLVDLLDVQRDAETSRDNPEDPDLNYRSDSERDKPVTKNMFKEIVDKLTLTDDEVIPGRINVNTAPFVVIRTLPEIDDETTDAIVRAREGAGGGYSSIGDLLDVAGMTKEKFAKIENYLTVRSYVFHIQSHGSATSGLAKATIECIVDRGQVIPRLLYWLESSP